MPNNPTNYYARTQQLTRGNILQARDLMPGDVIAYRVPGAIELQLHTVTEVTLNTHVRGWVAVEITLTGGHTFTVDADMPVRVESAAPAVERSPRFTPEWASGDVWDTNGRTL